MITFKLNNLLFIFILFITNILALDIKKIKGWKQRHKVSGKLHLPFSDIIEPFTAWYDGVNNRSRVDYYNGMVKTYQYSNYNESGGFIMKIVPFSTNEVLNDELYVVKKAKNKTEKFYTQPVLPDIQQFHHIGNDTMWGMICEQFIIKQIYHEKEITHTLWIRLNETLNSNLNETIFLPTPIRYEMRSTNKILGSHYDYFYIDYNVYDYTNTDNYNEIFNITKYLNALHKSDKNKNINSVSLNPMQEFIHPINTENYYEDEFNSFLNKHQRGYYNNDDNINNSSEFELRKNIFRNNLRFIQSKNRENHNYKLKVNHLADKTNEEVNMLLGYRPSVIINDSVVQDVLFTSIDDDYEDFLKFDLDSFFEDDIPDQFDWRLYGAVTPVKDQSTCGSCWSFATTGVMEGAYFLKYQKLIRFSEQALIDCSWGEGNRGCDGGFDIPSYRWIKNMKGLPIDQEYGPYMAQDGYCHINKGNQSNNVGFIKYFSKIPTKNETAIKRALLKYGPIFVAINGSPKTLQFYSHGVYYDANCEDTFKNLNHAVLLVGYGVLNDEPYWLIKNSWSTHWGNDGYVLISTRDNNCGVMTTPSYIIM